MPLEQGESLSEDPRKQKGIFFFLRIRGKIKSDLILGKLPFYPPV